MAHFSRLAMIVIDASPEAHDQELSFWQSALAVPLVGSQRFPAFHGAALGESGLVLLTQRLDDGDSRIHLDMHTTDVESEVARLEALGAVRVRRLDEWWIMRDPAGLTFCVVLDPSLDETTANRWD